MYLGFKTLKELIRQTNTLTISKGKSIKFYHSKNNISDVYLETPHLDYIKDNYDLHNGVMTDGGLLMLKCRDVHIDLHIPYEDHEDLLSEDNFYKALNIYKDMMNEIDKHLSLNELNVIAKKRGLLKIAPLNFVKRNTFSNYEDYKKDFLENVVFYRAVINNLLDSLDFSSYKPETVIVDYPTTLLDTISTMENTIAYSKEEVIFMNNFNKLYKDKQND